MIKSLATLTMVATLVSSLSGCYLGKEKTGKTIAYTINGSLVAVGGLGVLSGLAADPGGSDANDGKLVAAMAVVPLVVGLIGIAINRATPTVEDPPRPRSVATAGKLTLPQSRYPAIHVQ